MSLNAIPSAATLYFISEFIHNPRFDGELHQFIISLGNIGTSVFFGEKFSGFLESSGYLDLMIMSSAILSVSIPLCKILYRMAQDYFNINKIYSMEFNRARK